MRDTRQAIGADVPHCQISAIQGQVLRRSARREAAIVLLEDWLWVADFVDGRGELIDAATWIRFNCAGAEAGHAYRRMALESALPLSAELVARIETLARSDRAAGRRSGK